MKIIHILGAGRWQVPTIKMAKELDVKVLVTDRDPRAEGFKYADFHEAVDIIDVESTLKVARKYDVDGIMPVSDYGIRSAAYIAEDLGLRGLKPEIAEVAVDKGLFFDKFRKHSVPIPETVTIRNFEEAKEFAGIHGFPLYFKPVDNMGASRGIKRIDRQMDLQQEYDYSMSFSEAKRLIIQKYIAGIEHNVESLTHEGNTSVLTISDKKFPPEPKNYPYYNVESIYYPTAVLPQIKNDIEKSVKAAVKAIGIDFGPTHIEVIHNEEGAFVIDFGARGGGGHVFSTIIDHVTGVNSVRESVRMALGEEPLNLVPLRGWTAVYQFFQNYRHGRINAIEGEEQVRCMKEVADFDILVKVGDLVEPIRTSTQRLGFAVILTRTRSEAEAISKKIRDIIHIEVVAR